MPFSYQTTFYIDQLNSSYSVSEIDKPAVCPQCHHAISPMTISVIVTRYSIATICYFCPSCKKPFLTDYSVNKTSNVFHSNGILKSYPVQDEQTVFDNSINLVSPYFVEIFNQSKSAESANLHHISGVGYRKSLEFLVKDYASYLNADNEDEISKIRSMSLVQCIDKYITHPRIKPITKRAAWLGNDETHYVRKYSDEDINTLKALIKLSENWITMDLDSAELEKRIVHPSELEKK